MASETYKAPKGTADLLGSSARGWDLLQETARTVFTRYGYEPIYTPVFEHTEVFARGIGEATDVVGKEMYSFVDRGGRQITLRPENTAGVVRAAIEAHLTDNGGAAKLYYGGPMFRYERPQKGRQRQFYQIGAEALGQSSPLTDAEMILMLWDYFTTLGLRGNSRVLTASRIKEPDGSEAVSGLKPVSGLGSSSDTESGSRVHAGSMRLLVNSMGDAACRPAYRDSVAAHIRAHAGELCDDCVRRADTNPLRAFDCKNERCRAVMAGAPRIEDALCDDCRAHFAAVLELLDAAGLKYEIDPRLVRGLDYYTRTVFEIQVDHGLGSQNAIGGGGRYDGLFEQLGGKPTPGIGFALGAERTLLALEASDVDAGADDRLVVYVAAAADEQRSAAFAMTRELRGRNLTVLCDLQDRSLKGQFKQADKAGAGYVLVLGEDEVARGGVTLRNMETKEERFCTMGSVVKALKSKTAKG